MCLACRFKPLHEAIMSSRIEHIAEKEGVELAPDAMATLAAVSGGDLRKAITTLQSAARLSGGERVER